MHLIPLLASAALSGCSPALPPPPSPEDYFHLLPDGGADATGGTGSQETGPQDTGLSGGADTGGTTDPVWDAPDWAYLSSVPVDRGFTWARDETFSLDNHSVPTVLRLGEDDFRMLATDMGDMGNIYQWRGPDGLSWTQDTEPVFSPEMFEEDCGDSFLDTAVVYLPDGRVRVLIEGFNLTGTVGDETDTSTICSAVTSDGESWTLEGPGQVFAASDEEAGWSSVLEVAWYPAAQLYLMYYVGGGRGEAWDGTIHLATSSDGERFTSSSEDWTISTLGDVDPSPVWEETGTGLRLYHTRDHPGGKLGLMTSADGRSFEDRGFLPDLDTQDCDWEGSQVVEGDACPMDPFYLRLGDQLVIYYTVHEPVEGQTHARIARAFATD